MTKEPTQEDIEQLKALGYEVILETDGAWTCLLEDEKLTHCANATELSAWTEATEHRDLVELIEDAKRNLGEAEGAASCGELENTRWHLETIAGTLAEAVKQKPLPNEYTMLVRAPDGMEISGTGPSMDALMEGLGFVRKDDARATANDPKLSDSRSWRAGCMVGERWRQEAASVTAERVRCSAWLGVAGSRCWLFIA